MWAYRIFLPLRMIYLTNSCWLCNPQVSSTSEESAFWTYCDLVWCSTSPWSYLWNVVFCIFWESSLCDANVLFSATLPAKAHCSFVCLRIRMWDSGMYVCFVHLLSFAIGNIFSPSRSLCYLFNVKSHYSWCTNYKKSSVSTFHHSHAIYLFFSPNFYLLALCSKVARSWMKYLKKCLYYYSESRYDVTSLMMDILGFPCVSL
jgi:hypothetical protein